MDLQKVNGLDYFLPKKIDDVVWLVNDAVAKNEIICVRGAAHSFPLINTLEKGSTGGRPYKYVMLSYLDNVTFLDNDLVKVEAGCHLGPDPWDPVGVSTTENSLCFQLNNKGLALPDLGGITHQTIGGFLSTGSSGGSTKFSFEDALMSVDIVTCEGGTATIKTFSRPADGNEDDLFYGAGIATMGLFGIIVSATFKCVSKFYVTGDEATTYENTCEIDLFGDGTTGDPARPSLETFFKTTDYTRLMWWPQENVHKMVVWKARQATEQQANDWAKNAYQKMGEAPKPLKPYEEVPYVFSSPALATVGADFLFTAIGRWPGWLHDLLGDTPKCSEIQALVDGMFYPLLLPELLDIFVTIDTPDNKNKGPQLFSDEGWTGLPMDNQMSDKTMPVWFTEMWIDISQSQEVMKSLLDFYNKSTDNTGAFSCEIYPAKSNNFWLSPSYKSDVIRIDVFWFGNNSGDPVKFYQKFWTQLQNYNFRPHWGKYLPDSKGDQGVVYLQNNYPKWDNWRVLRQQLDPKQVFVNDYWRDHLGIEAP